MAHKAPEQVCQLVEYFSLKTEYIYINPEDNVPRLRDGIKDYIEYYNNRRCHQGIAHQIPMERYRSAA